MVAVVWENHARVTAMQKLLESTAHCAHLLFEEVCFEFWVTHLTYMANSKRYAISPKNAASMQL